MKDILIVTTPILESKKIIKYIKPVTSNLIIGAGFFSDFLASFTDLFGGNSTTYQKKVRVLYETAIDNLKNEAIKIGANAIIGLTVNVNEISGKGKELFMITAIGTAVIIEYSENEDNIESSLIDLELIKLLRKKKRIINECKSSKFRLTDDNWDYITNYEIYEIFDYVIFESNAAFNEYRTATEGSSTNKFIANLKNYINIVPDNIKIVKIYNALNTSTNNELKIILLETIKENNIIDLELINEMLNSSSLENIKVGLNLLQYDKSIYTKKDLDLFEVIVYNLKNNFKERGIRGTKKAILSSKLIDIWDCECGNKGNLNKYCPNCDKDIFGFKEFDFTNLMALKIIEEKIELIKEIITSSS